LKVLYPELFGVFTLCRGSFGSSGKSAAGVDRQVIGHAIWLRYLAAVFGNGEEQAEELRQVFPFALRPHQPSHKL